MALVFPGNVLPSLGDANRRKFLFALQRDVERSFFCFCCQKLQRLNPELSWEGQDHRRTSNWMNRYLRNSLWGNCSYTELRRHITFPSDYNEFMAHGDISFMDAYLIMNRHFHGLLHGISLQQLERSVSFETKLELDTSLHGAKHLEWFKALPKVTEEAGLNRISSKQSPATAWRFSLQYSPKIIDNKLYIARLFTINGAGVPWSHFARLVDSIKPKICCHMNCMVPMPPAIPTHYWKSLPYSAPGEFGLEFLPLAMRYHWKSCGFSPEKGSCLLCNTDYDISITQDALTQEWNFNCSTYHCLGSCRSTSDPLWYYFVSDGYERVKYLRQHHLSHDAGRPTRPDGNETIFGHPSMNGEVRRKWMENCTEAESLQFDSRPKA